MAFLLLPINLPPASLCSAARDDGAQLGPALLQQLLHTHSSSAPASPTSAGPEMLERALLPEGKKTKDKNLPVLPCVG